MILVSDSLSSKPFGLVRRTWAVSAVRLDANRPRWRLPPFSSGINTLFGILVREYRILKRSDRTVQGPVPYLQVIFRILLTSPGTQLRYHAKLSDNRPKLQGPRPLLLRKQVGYL